MKNLEKYIVIQVGESFYGKINNEKVVTQIEVTANDVVIHFADDPSMQITHDQTDGFELWIPK